MKTGALLGTLVLVAACAASLEVCAPGSRADLPRYTNGGELVRPENYQDWIFLTSVLHMGGESSGEGTFANVYVTPRAYRQFLASGSWPDKTVFVEEKRTSLSRVSKMEHFQTDLMGINVQVKDVARFRDKWGFFSFGYSQKTAKANPKARCWQCHNDGGAVDSTYVQVFPTLKPVAQKFGTYPPDYPGRDSY